MHVILYAFEAAFGLEVTKLLRNARTKIRVVDARFFNPAERESAHSVLIVTTSDTIEAADAIADAYGKGWATVIEMGKKDAAETVAKKLGDIIEDQRKRGVGEMAPEPPELEPTEQSRGPTEGVDPSQVRKVGGRKPRPGKPEPSAPEPARKINLEDLT